MRICRISTVPFFVLHHLSNQISAAAEAGHEVTVICSPGAGMDSVEKLPVARTIFLDIPRPISPLRDLRALVGLVRRFRQISPDIVHSATPKAGLLTALAAWIAGVPIRMHTFTGQAWSTLKGPRRWIVMTCDWIICHLNTMCYADSASQREVLIEARVSSPQGLRVLGDGSLAGIDLDRFNQQRWSEQQRRELRDALRIPANAPVITFVGRVTRDKGIVELTVAFREIQRRHPDAHLLVIGPLESDQDPVPAETVAELEANAGVRMLGYESYPERFLAITNIFCLPSYREGFGTVIIEAAAMGIPSVSTRIPGVIDAIVDGETGILVPPAEADALAKGLLSLIEKPDLYASLASAAQQRAAKLFSKERLGRLLLEEYATLRDAEVN